MYRKTKLARRTATLLPTPRMVVRRCSDTSTTGNRYFRVDRNEKPLGRCGLNVLLPTEKANLRITRQRVAERIRIVSSVVQTYTAWSRRWMRDEMVYSKVDRILNNILRSSSVFWLLTVGCSLNFFSWPEPCHLLIVIFEGLYTHTSTLWLYWYQIHVTSMRY